MHILLTNDDGVLAPGLLALVQSLNKLGKVSIIAPSKNWSASGHVKTMHRPLRVWATHLADGTLANASDGAPSDCVALGILGLVEKPIDLVVSGINPHANIGHDVTYSSTVMAAMEAAISGIPGIAVSMDSSQMHQGPLEYAPAAEIACTLIQQIMQSEHPPQMLLNMNIPYQQLENIRGVEITRQGTRVYNDELECRLDPRGKKYYWIGGNAPSGLDEPGTEFWALSNNYVSITPLKLDLTANEHIPNFTNLNLKLA
jgi:5'-nucleotidase